MRKFYDIRNSPALYKIVNYHYTSMSCILIKASLNADIAESKRGYFPAAF